MKFSLVVPTYKRMDMLKQTLESVLANSRLPDEVIVIDDDAVPVELVREFVTACSARGISFEYYKKDHAQIRRGLSESKNWGTKLAQGDVVCFLDDDVVLKTDYFSHLFSVWEENVNAEKLMGVGGRIINNRRTSKAEIFYRQVFGLGSKCDWDVNDVGFQVWNEGVSVTTKGYYLHGGVSSYRRQLLLKIPFANFSGGRTGLEDVEHCLYAKRKGLYFLYVPAAALYHYPQPAGRESAFLSGKKEGQNRQEIFRKHCRQDFKHRLWFVWANVGWISKKLLALKFREGMGMLSGLIYLKHD